MLLRLFMYSMQHGDTRLRAPYVDTLRASPYAPLYWHLDRVVGVLVCGDISVATFPRISLRVPYMKRVRGSPKGVIVLLLFYHKHTSPLGHPLRTPYVETSKSSPQVPPGIYEGLGYY